MESIILRDHKAIARRDVYKEEYEERELDTLAEHLQSNVTIEDNFTFGDLWKLLAKDSAFYEKVFRRAMGGYSFAPFDKDAKAEIEPDEEKLIAVELYHAAEVHDYTQFKKHAAWGREFEMYQGVHGIGPRTDERGNYNPEERWSLSFTPISTLMDLPLKLDKSVTVSVTEKLAKGKYKHETIKLGNHGFSVYEIINAILDEITFYGEPQDRAAQLAELDQRYQSVKDGTAEFRSVDDLMKELDSDEATDENEETEEGDGEE